MCVAASKQASPSDASDDSHHHSFPRPPPLLLLLPFQQEAGMPTIGRKQPFLLLFHHLASFGATSASKKGLLDGRERGWKLGREPKSSDPAEGGSRKNRGAYYTYYYSSACPVRFLARSSFSQKSLVPYYTSLGSQPATRIPPSLRPFVMSHVTGFGILDESLA